METQVKNLSISVPLILYYKTLENTLMYALRQKKYRVNDH